MRENQNGTRQLGVFWTQVTDLEFQATKEKSCQKSELYPATGKSSARDTGSRLKPEPHPLSTEISRATT